MKGETPQTIAETAFAGTEPAQQRSAESIGSGTTLGRYRVVARLGQGGMGTVYSAEDPQLDRLVAIKVLRRDRQGRSSHRRLVREAQAMARLSHPNVLPVYDVGEHEGATFIAMELVRGQSLRQWAKQPRKWRDVLRVFRAAGRGLAAAHRAGLVHRDFKPDNVMVGDDRRVRVMDFGLAFPGAAADSIPDAASSDTSLDMLATQMTKTGVAVGTPAYMPLEQHAGDDVDARADQYAFCVALFEALAGRRPFDGKTFEHLLRQKAHPGKIEIPPGPVPGRLWKVVLRGLSAEPAGRWPHMPAVLGALRRAGRRRSYAWVAAGAAVLGLAGWWAATSRRCDTDPASVDRIWNDAVKRSGTAAFTNSGLVFADQTWGIVEAGGDRWALAWKEVATGTCGVHDVLSTERRRCLRDGLMQLDALVELLVEGDPKTVKTAAGAMAGLPRPANCTDADRLSAYAAIDLDDVGAQELRDRLLALETRFRTGDVDIGPDIEALLADAREAGVPSVIHATQLLAGNAATSFGDIAAIESAHEKAFYGAQDDDVPLVAARAAAGLAFHRLKHHNDIEGAEKWIRHAESALNRVGDVWTVQAKIRNTQGALEVHRHDYDKARERFKQARDLFARGQGPSPTLAAAANNMGSLEHTAGNYEAARQYMQEAAEISLQLYGDSHPKYGSALLNLSLAVHNLGDVEEGIALMRQAVSLFEPLPNERPLYAEGLARLGAMVDSKDSAEILRRALRIQIESFGEEHPSVTRMRINLATTLADLELWQEAHPIAHTALQDAQKTSGAESDDAAAARHIYGTVLTNMPGADRAEAREALEHALATRRANYDPGHPYIADTLRAVANWHLDHGDPGDALALFEEGLGSIAGRLLEHNIRFGLAELGCGQARLAMGEPKAALVHFERAEKIAERARGDSTAAWAKYGIARARLQLDGDLGAARRLATQAQQGARDNGYEQAAHEMQAWLDAHPAP